MSSPVVVKCPHCHSELKIKNSALLGKKAPCPRCGEKFILEEAAPNEDEFDFGAGDDYGDDDYGAAGSGGDDDYDSPPSRSRSSTGSGKKKKGKKSRKKSVDWQGPAKVGGGVVLGLLLISGIVYGVMNLMSGRLFRGSPPDMAWMPNDTELVLQIRPSEILSSAPIQKLLGDPNIAPAISQINEKMGIGPADIEQISIGYLDPSALSRPGGTQPIKCSGVILLKKSLDVPKLVASLPGVETVEHEGKQLYFLQNPRTRIGFCFIEPQKAIIGSEAELKQALAANGACSAQSRFSWVNGNSHLVFAYVPKGGANSFPAAGMPGGLSLNSSQGISGTLDFGSTLTAALAIREKDAASAANTAEKMKTDVAAGAEKMAEAKKQAAGNPNMMMAAMMGANADGLMSRIEESLRSARTSSSGDVCQLTLRVPSEVIDDAKAMIAMAASFGGMGGMGARPSFGPPPMMPGQPYSPGMNPSTPPYPNGDGKPPTFPNPSGPGQFPPGP
jgi:hypothetical protein